MWSHLNFHLGILDPDEKKYPDWNAHRVCLWAIVNGVDPLNVFYDVYAMRRAVLVLRDLVWVLCDEHQLDPEPYLRWSQNYITPHHDEIPSSV